MSTFFSYIYKRSQQYNFHTNTFGLIRSLLALSSLLVLLFNPIEILFHTGLGVTNIPSCDNTFLSSINLFCILSFNLYLAKFVAIIILIFIILGYFPKFTGFLHVWVAFSVNTGLIVIDGGAQVTSEYYKIISYLTIQVLKIQIAYIYFDAAISKIFAHNWTEGTALYYFINDPISGASGIRLDLLNFIFDFPLFLVITTYFIMFLELFLSFSIFTTNKYIKYKLFIFICVNGSYFEFFEGNANILC